MNLKKKIFLAIGIILLTMIVIPFLITYLTFGLDGFSLLLILMFIGNPIVSIILGVLAGTEIRKLWWFPLTVSIIFLISYWIILRSIMLEFLIFSLVYLVIGMIAMGITKLIKGKK